tara:strand:- start:813 stop:1268 length:456 start_codon:yes stop_codon:yes gene_type:complete
MKSKTQSFLEFWQEARTRFSNQLITLQEADLKKKLPPSVNSVGFLIRHIGDVELLFAKNVFGDKKIHVIAKTVIAKRDTGEWTDLISLRAYVDHSFVSLKSAIEKMTDIDWEGSVTTEEFGTKTMAEALGRIASHTTHHSGQMAILIKYGL